MRVYRAPADAFWHYSAIADGGKRKRALAGIGIGLGALALSLAGLAASSLLTSHPKSVANPPVTTTTLATTTEPAVGDSAGSTPEPGPVTKASSSHNYAAPVVVVEGPGITGWIEAGGAVLSAFAGMGALFLALRNRERSLERTH